MKDEQVIETLTPHTAQEALTDGIGTRGLIRGGEHLDATRLRNPFKAHTKFAIMISDEILRSRAKGGGLPQLLRRPSVGGRAGHADVNHLARVQFDDEKGEERVEEEIGHWEKVTRPDLLGMSLQERPPRLSSWSCGAHGSHVLLNGAFADTDTQFE